MTDFLRSILQTAHNASAVGAPVAPAVAASAGAPQTPVKSEVRPVDQIQVPAAACAAGASAASLLALETQRVIKVEDADASSKAQRAARRDAVNARRETKRKTMSSPSSDSEDYASASSSPRASALEGDKAKKMKTGKASGSSSSAASLLFGAEIDALGEERLRAMEAQLESLDPDSKEAKKKRRLIRNRMSAQLHRERKKAYVGQLEDQLLEKERELKALQDKLDALASESLRMQQQLAQTQTQTQTVTSEATTPAATTTATTVASPAAAAVVTIEDDVVIKTEPIVDVASAFDASAPATPAGACKESWEYCFPPLADAEMADVAADELLRGLEHPFAAYAAAVESEAKAAAPAPEIHAAKKNLVMVMGMMFSATFFGNSPFYYDVQSGSTFSSYFQANPPKDVAQLNIASKIVSSLEKSSWKDFRDIASWTTTKELSSAEDDETDETDKTADDADASEAARAAASPSAASDVTDSSGAGDSPAAQRVDDCLGLAGLETDLIDEFVYPVDDPFAPALADTNWFGDDADDFGQSDVDDNTDDDVVMASASSSVAAVAAAATAVATAASSKSESSESESTGGGESKSISSRLFEKLTALWHEKNQVLLTVLDGKNEVTRRSVADMSAIRKSMENGSLFSAGAPAVGAAAKTSPLGTDESVSFLYPLSAFSPGAAGAAAAEKDDPDVMFLEVSCQMSALSM